MFLHPLLVGNAFLKLRERDKTAKTGVERTSSLFRFFAFDALCKIKRSDQLLFDPMTGMGKENRKDLIDQYKKIALISLTDDRKEWIVDNLGECNTDGCRSCRGKVANDFFTVQLKKASQSECITHYPKRPAALMNIGVNLHGKNWGISKNQEWRSNIVQFIDNRKSSCFWTDLAVFIFRAEWFEGDDFWNELTQALHNRFTNELSHFWAERIMRFEKLRYPEPEDHFSEKYIEELTETKYSVPRKISQDIVLKEEVTKLKARIRELEKEIIFLRSKEKYS